MSNKPTVTSGPKVEDENDIGERRAVKRVQDCIDAVTRVRTSLSAAELEMNISDHEARRALYRAVDSLYQVLSPQLQDEDLPQQQEYWHETHLGTIRVTPPEVMRESSRGEARAKITAGSSAGRPVPRSAPEPREYRVQGMQDWSETKPEWTETFEAIFDVGVSVGEIRTAVSDQRDIVDISKVENTGVVQVTLREYLDEDIINQASTELMNFARELGYDVEMTGGEWRSTEPGL